MDESSQSPSLLATANVEEESSEPAAIRVPVRVDFRSSLVLDGLLILAVFYTLYVARTFLIPLVLAFLLSCLFSPVVRKLKRVSVPEALSAAVIVVGLIATVSYSVYRLSGPAGQWISRAPQSLERIESRLRQLRLPMEQVSKAADQVEKATVGDDGAFKVEIKGQTVVEAFFGGTQYFLASAVVVSVLLYFLLASGDLFLTKVIKVLPKLGDKKLAVQISRETEAQVSYYLGATVVINIVFGSVVGLAMWFVGMPNPALWGVVAGVTNFIPYVGGILCTLILGIVALIQSDSLAHAFTVAAVFFVINTLEGSVLTPMFLGRQLRLNPVVIFIGVLLWGWLWGIPGMLLAVPIMATIKILCDHIPALAPISEFLGQ